MFFPRETCYYINQRMFPSCAKYINTLQTIHVINVPIEISSGPIIVALFISLIGLCRSCGTCLSLVVTFSDLEYQTRDNLRKSLNIPQCNLKIYFGLHFCSFPISK